MILRLFDTCCVQIGAAFANFALFINIYLFLYLVFGKSILLVKLLNYITVWLLLFMVAAFFVLLLMPKYHLWKLYPIPGIVFFFIWYGGLFVPRIAEDTDELGFRVATYNIAGVTSQIDEKVAVMRSLDADILGIQEARGLNTELLGNHYPFSQSSNSGLSLLSKYPLVESQTQLISPPSSNRTAVLRIVVEFNQKRIAVYVVHPLRPTLHLRPFSYDDKDLQATYQQLLESLKVEPYPTMLLCDCNITERSASYAAIEQRLIDAWRVRGRWFGFTATGDFGFPVIRSDMIWVSEEIGIHSIQVWQNSGSSDHYPVVATLFLKPASD